MSTLSSINPLVQSFIEKLESRFPGRKWPRYLYHYSDIVNIVEILKEGILYSRSLAQSRGLLQIDSAGQNVLSNTETWLYNYVRLYFRPVTPPLWHVEGFCPENNRHSKFQAHGPLPVYLVFDSIAVLSIPNVKFSECNLACSQPQTHLYDSPKHLHKLDFESIYHHGPIITDDLQEKEKIIDKRCAEVIIEDALPLTGFLKWVICRSPAERETLLNLLEPKQRQKFSGISRIWGPYFNRHKHFIESANLSATDMRFCYINSGNPFSYRYLLEFQGRKHNIARDAPVSGFRWNKTSGRYTVSVFIDEHIAYKGVYQPIRVLTRKA
jgi:hypothetical protein